MMFWSFSVFYRHSFTRRLFLCKVSVVVVPSAASSTLEVKHLFLLSCCTSTSLSCLNCLCVFQFFIFAKLLYNLISVFFVALCAGWSIIISIRTHFYSVQITKLKNWKKIAFLFICEQPKFEWTLSSRFCASVWVGSLTCTCISILSLKLHRKWFIVLFSMHLFNSILCLLCSAFLFLLFRCYSFAWLNLTSPTFTCFWFLVRYKEMCSLIVLGLTNMAN